MTNNLCIEGRFHLDINLNGYVGLDGNGNVILGFSGTEKDSWDNWKTDARQYFGSLDPVYVNAAMILDALWQEKSKGHTKRNSSRYFSVFKSNWLNKR